MQPATVSKAPAHLIASRRGRRGDDPIFSLHQEAVVRRARGEAILDATIGILLQDDGSLAILPTAARAVRDVAPAEWAAYAPIAGNTAFLAAVVEHLFGRVGDLAAQGIATATPGGSGAVRHAIASFLEPGQAMLTTSYYWSPYDTIADETGRRVLAFPMFDAGGNFDVGALDEALSSCVARQGRALLVLNDPCHNPTGYSMTSADWSEVVDAVGRHASSAPVSVLLDAAYSAFGPSGCLDAPLRALERVADRALVLVAWSASKTFTHYGLRVGALAAVVPDAARRAEIGAALSHASRGTWSNCNRGGMSAITRLLVDPALRAAADAERRGFVSMLADRGAAFHAAAARAGLAHPAYRGGFFGLVFAPEAPAVARRLRESGVYVVPLQGAVRLGLCAVPESDVPRLVDAVARALG